MIKKLKLLVNIAAMSFLLLTPVLASGVARAQENDIKDSLCSGVEINTLEEGGGDCSSAEGATGSVQSVAMRIVSMLSWLVGVVSIIMIIIGGFRYITSGGDSNKVTSAKNTIIYALIGLVLVALSQFIVRFVLDEVTSVDPSAFNITLT